MYYEAREKALTNQHPFHLAAIAKVGSEHIIGVNSERCSAKFRRNYSGEDAKAGRTASDDRDGYQLHAEMDLIQRIPKVPSQISVMRFRADGTLTMALPCRFCMRHLKKAGVRTVKYTDWNGEWQTISIGQA